MSLKSIEKCIEIIVSRFYTEYLEVISKFIFFLNIDFFFQWNTYTFHKYIVIGWQIFDNYSNDFV